jgi:DNA topoisomerase-1
VKDPDTLKRIRSLVIPPAWTSVWICARQDGHLQASGRDDRGRKQYRYHQRYRQFRDQTKFGRMTAFAAALPKIRARVDADLKLDGLSRTKVLATIIRLLEATCIRVGNEVYVQQNESFGLTTLRNRHVDIGGQTIRFRFKGKSGQVHDIRISDRRLAKIVHACQCLPGQQLFEYIGDDGSPCKVCSDDVNEYLRELAGEEFTAKDFRTWIGTTEAVTALEKMGPPENSTTAKRNIVEAIRMVAQKLGNRPAASKAYYIHPAVLEAYATGSFFDTIHGCREGGGLRREEKCALAIIEASESNAISLVPRLKQSLR